MDLEEKCVNTRNWLDSAYWRALLNAALNLWVMPERHPVNKGRTGAGFNSTLVLVSAHAAKALDSVAVTPDPVSGSLPKGRLSRVSRRL